MVKNRTIIREESIQCDMCGRVDDSGKWHYINGVWEHHIYFKKIYQRVGGGGCSWNFKSFDLCPDCFDFIATHLKELNEMRNREAAEKAKL